MTTHPSNDVSSGGFVVAVGLVFTLVFGGIPPTILIVVLSGALSVIAPLVAIPSILLLLGGLLYGFFNPRSKQPRSNVEIALLISTFIWVFIVGSILVYIGSAFGSRTRSGSSDIKIDTSLIAPRPTNLIESNP